MKRQFCIICELKLVGKQRLVCSTKCYNVVRCKHRREISLEKASKIKPTRCENDGCPKMVQPQEVRRGKRKVFCSRRCCNRTSARRWYKNNIERTSTTCITNQGIKDDASQVYKG